MDFHHLHEDMTEDNKRTIVIGDKSVDSAKKSHHYWQGTEEQFRKVN